MTFKQPFFNWVLGKAKHVRKKYIIDIPPMKPERQQKIIDEVSKFAQGVIAKSLAEMIEGDRTPWHRK